MGYMPFFKTEFDAKGELKSYLDLHLRGNSLYNGEPKVDLEKKQGRVLN